MPGGDDATASAPAASGRPAAHHAEPRGHGPLAEGERAPARPAPAAPRPDRRPTCAAGSTSSTATASASASPTTSCATLVAGVRTHEQLVDECDVILQPKPLHARPRRAARGAGPLGLAALRAGRGAHPAGHRPPAHADRLRGDEPLEAATARSTCTSSTRTTSSPATARCCTPCSSSGIDRQLRPPAARRRHRLRRHRPRRGHGADRARRRRRRHPHPPPGRRRGLADPLGPDPALRPRRRPRAGVSHAVTPEGRVPLAEFLGRARHHRQLRAAGHRRPARLPHRRRPGRALARHDSSSTCPATRGWASAGRGRRRSPSRRSRWATTCSTTPSTTARRTCGTRPPGRSARPCCRSCAP